ncbi:MAG: hypothetical protein ABIP50_03350 [Candidatus Saccharimonadales bacterium]
MAHSLRMKAFLASDQAEQIRVILQQMADDPGFNTKSTYSPITAPLDMLFVDRHMKYLSEHPAVNPEQYISNLRLITKCN